MDQLAESGDWKDLLEGPLSSSTSTVTLISMVTPQVLAKCPKLQQGKFVEFVSETHLA